MFGHAALSPHGHLTRGGGHPAATCWALVPMQPACRVSHVWQPSLTPLLLAHLGRMFLMSVVWWLSAWLLPVILRFIVSPHQGTCWENMHLLYSLMGRTTDENAPSHWLIMDHRKCTQKRMTVMEDVRESNVRAVILFSSPFYCFICGGNHSAQLRQLNHITNLLRFAWHINSLSGPCSWDARAPLSAGLLTCVLEIAECFNDFIIILRVWLAWFISMCKLILCSLKCNTTKLCMVLQQ